jgi:YHS domain-containing protein
MKTLSILFIAFTFSIHSGLAQSSPGVRKQQFNLEKGVAIQGYDPVAYFTQNKANPGRAVKGSAANAFTYKNVTYHFASAANLKAFQENPISMSRNTGAGVPTLWVRLARRLKSTPKPSR